MAGKCGFLSPVTEIESRIKEKIKFQTEVEGKLTILGTCQLPDLEANKRIEVDKWKIKEYCRQQPKTWRIQVLLDGNPTGLYLEPIHLLRYTRIVFEYKVLEDGNKVLSAGGLEVSSRGMAQLRGLGRVTLRNRKYENSEKRFGLKGIGEVRLEMEETREDEAPNHTTGGCHDWSSQEIANDLHVITDHIASGCAEPVVANEKARSDYKSLMYHPPSIIGCRKVAEILASDVQPEIQRWKLAIVGYLIGEDTQDLNVERYVNEQWRDFGPFKTYVLKPRFFLFNFTNGVHKSKVLEQGQLFISKRPFILKSWMPDLPLDPSLFLASIPVWVRFPYLSLQFFSPTALAKISSFIGEPLFADEPTVKRERLQYARVCIEIKLGDKLPDMIPIFVDDNDTILEQAVEYEWKPQPCGYCCSLGHYPFECALSSKFGASLKEGGDMIDLFSEGAEVGIRHKNEKPGLTNDNDDGHNGNSTAVSDNCNAEDVFCGLPHIKSQDSNASSPLVKSEIGNGTTEMLENGEDYSATACLLNSDKNAAMNWLSYYGNLKDIGFAVKRHLLG